MPKILIVISHPVNQTMDKDRTNGTVSDFLSIISYNTSGWNNNIVAFLNVILLNHDILIFAIQEHWLLERNLFKLEEVLTDFDVFALPASKSNSRISKGRPSGGIAFFVKNNLSAISRRLICPNSNRVQGLQFNLDNKSFVLINCYFPVDKRSANMDLTEIIQCLQDVQYLIDLCDDDSIFVIAGDLNTAFNRDTIFVHMVKNFLSDNNLEITWNKFDCDYTYSFSKFVNGLSRTYFSIIDHFCISSFFMDNCVEARPLHTPDNLSHHEPIFLKLKAVSNEIRNVNSTECFSTANNVVINRPAWSRATEGDLYLYKLHLSRLLENIEIPSSISECTDLKCSNVRHKWDIDFYSLKIMGAIDKAVSDTIPFTRTNNKRKSTPGWNQYVRPFREDSLFWHSVWVSAGRPNNTVLHQIMKSTRAKYHFAIKTIRKLENEMRKDKMLQDSLNGEINNILKHIKKSRKSQKGPPNNIDGVVGNDNISSHFGNIYKDIYNRHDSTNELKGIFSEINREIRQTDCLFLNKISIEMICGIVRNFKYGKNDETYCFGSDAFKYGSEDIAPHLVNLFKAFLVHGHISHPFLCCALQPILKNSKKSKFNSDNYRLIAISSILLKIFDHIILSISKDDLNFNNLQFGFQKNNSSPMCSWMLLETVNYFTNRGGPVYLCLLDLKKAFDTVKHDLLFSKLRSRVHPLLLRLVIYSYLYQSVYVRWAGTVSGRFSVLNGVRQGAVASPIFFNVYTNDLFNILRNSGYGCNIDNLFYGLISYADDSALLAPSREALQKMVSLCEKYFDDHGIEISVDTDIKKSKTKCIAFNMKQTPQNIFLYNKPLPWVDSHEHLGNRVHKDESMSHDLLCKRAEYIGNVHALQQELGSQDPSVLIKLVRIYFCSFYGSNLWDLFDKSANKLFSTWNTSIRNFYDLPYATHRYILQSLSGGPHLKTILCRRFLKFYCCLRDSPKYEVRHLFNLQKYDVRSTFGRNCLNICRERGFPNIESMDMANLTDTFPTPPNEAWRMPCIKELCFVRDGYASSILSKQELDFVLDFVCTT